MKKFWIITQLFYPDETSTGYVMTKIAEKLTEIGQVNVICGTSNYQSKNLNTHEKLNGKINLLRVQTPNFNKNKLLGRVFIFFYFTTSVFFKIISRVKKQETIVLVTNPPTLLFVVGLMKKAFKFKLIIILQDIFPENAAASGILNKKAFVYKFILRFMNFGYNQADKLIACGEDMAQYFTANGIDSNKISVIPNWADHELILPGLNIDRNEYFNMDLNDKVIIEFAGNIGRVQGLNLFLNLFEKTNNDKLVLIIIGDGANKKNIQKHIQDKNLKNVFLFSSKPRNEQNAFLNSCDIGLVTLCNGMFGLGVPSKVYNIMSAGKPILYIGDKKSEVDKYITRNNIGWSFDWSEENKIIDFLNNISQIETFDKIGQAARNFVLNNFTQEKVLSQYKEYLN
jgi:glycosyltransferase involved in cell wall biosynthesis